MRRRSILIASQGGGGGGILPSGYTRLNYIEGTGTQFINTGVTLASDTTKLSIDIDADINMQASDKGVCGNNDGGTYRFVVGMINRRIYAFCADGSNTQSSQYSAGYHRLNINATYDRTGGTKSLTIDGTSYSRYLDRRIDNNYSIRLLTSNTAVYAIQAKVYSFILKVNDSVVANLVPCLDDNSIPCMYDTVRKQTLYNAGTGSFLYG